MTDSLRAAIAADLAPVRHLRTPLRRSLAVVPLAVALLFAAPVMFAFRRLDLLGWWWSWGMSVAQAVTGVLLIAAALRDAVPGRRWPPATVAALFGLPIAMVALSTLGSWARDPVVLASNRIAIGLICVAGSFAGALPVVLVASVLARRAYPTRPAATGALGGLGAGLIADAGWRLFCHFSDPGHVFGTHLFGVLLAAAAGAVLLPMLSRRVPQ